MDWQIAAAIGELLGAMGVIASLVYLARQVYSNAAQTRQAAAQSIVSGFNDHLAELADPAQAGFFFPGLVDGLASYSAYSDVAAFSAQMFTFTRRYEELFHYHRAGAVDDWVWQGVNRMMSDVLSNPGAREWWAVRGEWFSKDFRALVDETMSKHASRLESDYDSRLGVRWDGEGAATRQGAD